MKGSAAVEKIMASLSTREKIQQTVVALMEKGKTLDYCPGAAFFFGQIITEADEAGLDELRSYVSELVSKCPIPPLITSDFENGCGTMVKGLTPLPYLMGLGATDNPQIAYDYGKATALEARSVGANWTFSPVCDLNVNRRNPLVNNRALTDDADLACRMLPEIIRGMQENGLIACAKHFPGDGVDYRDQHITTTENSLPLEQWKQTFGKVYTELIKTGVDTIMAGHITLPDYPQELSQRFGQPLPATLNKALLTDLLKNELGFEGIIVSDALNMGGFSGWFNTRGQAEIEAFKAGNDMLLWPTEDYVENMEKALASGEVSMERLDEAVARILTVKEKYGLLAAQEGCFHDITQEDAAFIANTQRSCSEQGITLVRDYANRFPLSPEKTGRIGIVVVAEWPAAKLDAAALREELEARGFQVDYRDTRFQKEDEQKEFYQRNDLVLYALFSRPFRPMGFLDYTQSCAAMMQQIFVPDNAVDKCAFVSFGSPYFGQQYLQKAQTYINAYSMLECAVRAFVRVACGEVPFTGKSPVNL